MPEAPDCPRDQHIRRYWHEEVIVATLLFPECEIRRLKEGIKSGNVSETSRRHGIAPNLFYRWKDEAEQGAKAAPGGRSAAAAETEKDHRIRQLERTLGRKLPPSSFPRAGDDDARLHSHHGSGDLAISRSSLYYRKLFFFVSYQEARQTNGVSGIGYSSITLSPIPGGNQGTCPVGFASPLQCDQAGATIPRGDTRGYPHGVEGTRAGALHTATQINLSGG